MLILDKRLGAVINEIDGDVLADIGCDHGKIAIAALQQGKCKRAIASDISEKSLQKAKALAEKCKIDNIEFLVSDGFAGYENIAVNVAVIAGMGGKEIVNILANEPKGIAKLILVANTDVILLRTFLLEKGKYIDKDYTIQVGRYFYNLLVVVANSNENSNANANGNSQNIDKKILKKELLLGKNTFDNQSYINYLFVQQKKYKRILASKADESLKQQSKENLEIVDSELSQCVII
ncbi:MAG: class I SAM-dependent methyltransferase [Clostridia bacterium]